VALRKKKENGVSGGAAETRCFLQLLLHISLMKDFSSNVAIKMQLQLDVSMGMLTRVGLHYNKAGLLHISLFK